MNLNAFVPALSRRIGIGDQALLERDVRLHLLLQRLTSDASLEGNLVFKGGTCLIKCHLGYWRFSEDLDFTWRDQSVWEDQTSKKARAAIGKVRKAALEIATRHAAALGMSLGTPPTFGRSGQLVTVVYDYRSLAAIPSYVKLQVNFLEPILFGVTNSGAASLLRGISLDELRLVDEDLTNAYAKPVDCVAYDPREILAEKGRAILTRQAAKGRDVLDLYLMERHLGLRVEDFIPQIEQKTRFSIERRQLYRNQLERSEDRFRLLREEDVRPLLIREIDVKDFEEHRRRVIDLLREEGTRILRNTPRRHGR